MISSGSSQFNISVLKTARVQGLISALFVCVAICTSANAQVANVVDDWASTEARLSTVLRDGSSEQKRNALLEIRNLRSDRASRVAIPALRDKDPIVRATAAASVVFAPKSEASGALIPLLEDKQEFVRREAAYALGEVQDQAGTALLLRLMQQDKFLEVRTAAAVSLGKIGDSTAIDSLLAILKTRPREAEEFLRRSAARSIGQIVQISVTGNTSVLTPQNFLPEKFKDLGSSASTGAIPSTFAAAANVLTTVLQNKSESDDTRREAAFGLGAIGDQRSIPVLQTYLSADDPYLAEICKEALLKIERRNKTPGSTD